MFFMDMMQLIPSPEQILEQAICLASSVLAGRRRRIIDMTRPQRDFDIDPTTGFLPSKPLPHLTGEYSLWEQALSDGLETVKLGEDTSDEAIASRDAAEKWRAAIVSVSAYHVV
jgi:indoleamine 2,3-dioxygenase